jgi:hypothetical protein
VASVPSLYYAQVGLFIYIKYVIRKCWMRIPVPCRAHNKIHPNPPLPKEGLFPLFYKEGAGEIFTGVVSFKQYIFLN